MLQESLSNNNKNVKNGKKEQQAHLIIPSYKLNRVGM